ncbi:ribonuclease YeeF family protein [Cytobacillus horneckiae]|uniref:ribonuclease YeeF family protein n=1 Tax=Cytobacillus horneckiae TaxID=549687 RepID=UPI00203BAEE2|nr:T7SS effector LXG polymorphic toxin [Cytobacillus horneckiae]MCM3180978.1 T7SS effector LXG polymorphic toxin [Cytobacillus horneckiae]
MKVLDAEQLYAGIQETITVLLQLKKQLEQIEQNLQSFISLEGELKGEGGKSIRSFYQESHLPFLTYMKDTIDQYEAILLEMRNALRSLEPSGQGFIRQSFIENDVEQGLRKAETITRDLTGEGNATIQSVSDIVSLPRLNEGDFIQQANRAGSHADQTLQKLHQFDRSQTAKLEKVDQDLRTLNRTVTEIKSLFQTGKLSISQYKPTQLAMELSGLSIPNFSQFLAYGPASIHLGTNEMLMKAETFRIAGTEVKDVKESQSSMGWLSTTLDFVPGVSNIKAGVEAISGKDFITGREIGYLERGALVAAIFGGPIVKGATKVVKWGGKHLSKLKNVFNPDKIKAVIDDALKAVTKGFNTLRNTAAHLSEKISNIRIPTWQPAYATPNGTPIQPTTLGEAANDVKKQIVSMAGKVKDGVGKGAGEATTKKNTVPNWLKERWEAGNNFNKENRPRYPYNEVELEAKEVGGKRYVVDSYAPNKEIVSRKLTQLSEVQEKTAKSYLNEITKKYPSGSKISNSTFNPNALKGGRLKGELILEVPVQNKPIPQIILDEATKNRIIIRDIKGKVYN